jgi:hypothetical protein
MVLEEGASDANAASLTMPDAKRPSSNERPPAPKRRNQLLAAALVSVMSGLFVLVVGLVMFLHYAELHHLFTSL